MITYPRFLKGRLNISDTCAIYRIRSGETLVKDAPLSYTILNGEIVLEGQNDCRIGLTAKLDSDIIVTSGKVTVNAHVISAGEWTTITPVGKLYIRIYPEDGRALATDGNMAFVLRDRCVGEFCSPVTFCVAPDCENAVVYEIS